MRLTINMIELLELSLIFFGVCLLAAFFSLIR